LFVWDKIRHNMGHYNSVRCELLYICTRGSCRPDNLQLIDSVQSIERGKHSEKPVEFYDIIETLYTHGRKLEMFARKRRDGWDAWGHVAEISQDGHGDEAPPAPDVAESVKAVVEQIPAVRRDLDAYDARLDMDRSVKWAYQRIRDRVARGGRGWGGYGP
jgi:hypothetical protein